MPELPAASTPTEAAAAAVLAAARPALNKRRLKSLVQKRVHGINPIVGPSRGQKHKTKEEMRQQDGHNTKRARRETNPDPLPSTSRAPAAAPAQPPARHTPYDECLWQDKLAYKAKVRAELENQDMARALRDLNSTARRSKPDRGGTD